MKTFLLSIFLFVTTYAFALAPWETASLQDHLQEVNSRWQLVETDAIDFSQELSFSNDIDRIYMHLKMVEKLLTNSTPSSLSKLEQRNREKLLEILALYREAKQFPINHYHASRRPYFIDNNGTACAVGHLIQESGNEEFADRIAQEMNFSYLMDMPYPELDVWADTYGFTKTELALIQPGYSPVVTWSGVGEGSDGEITTLYSDEANQRMIIAGDFTKLGGTDCGQVGTYANGIFSCLGSGVSGEIHAATVFENKIYLGGSFEGGANIAIWSEGSWTFERFGNGAVYALEVFDGYLVAGGDFVAGTVASDSLSYLVKMENGKWAQLGNFLGPVYTIGLHMDELYAGGNLNLTASPPYYVAKYAGGRSWLPVANSFERLDNTVRSLASDGTHLYAAGDCFDDAQNTTFGLARLGNSGWERLIDAQTMNLSRYSLKKVFLHEGAILLAGNYNLTPFVGIYGGGISKFRPSDTYPDLEALALVDSTVNAVASLGGELFMGGAFMRNNGDTVNHMVKTNNLTSIDRDKLISVGFYPNPMKTEVKAILDSPTPITHLSIFDMTGKQISVPFQINGNEINIQRGRLSSGMYMVKLLAGKEVIGHGKILVE